MSLKYCTQYVHKFEKMQQWPQDWKMSVFIPIQQKENTKGYSKYSTIALMSHASKIMLKIFQGSHAKYVNW